jgi:hypothetical protein
MRSTPLSHLFVETDESSTPIEKIYAKLAELRGVPTDDLTTATEENFKRLLKVIRGGANKTLTSLTPLTTLKKYVWFPF